MRTCLEYAMSIDLRRPSWPGKLEVGQPKDIDIIPTRHTSTAWLIAWDSNLSYLNPEAVERGMLRQKNAVYGYSLDLHSVQPLHQVMCYHPQL